MEEKETRRVYARQADNPAHLAEIEAEYAFIQAVLRALDRGLDVDALVEQARDAHVEATR